MDLTKFGDFSTLFHPYGVDVLLYYEKEKPKPWVLSIVFHEPPEHWTREEETYEAVMEALMEAYHIFLGADEEIDIVA